MKKSLALTFLVIGAIVDIITLIVDFKDLLVYWLGINVDMAASIKICIIVFFTLLSIACAFYLYFLIKQELKDAGTHEIPVAIVPYWRYKKQFKMLPLLRIMHCDLYHKLLRSENEISRKKRQRPQEQRNNPLSVNDAIPELTQLLDCFHTILYDIFKLDLSISFYLSELEDGNTVLTRCLFLQSRKEQNRGHNRTLNYKYFIESCNRPDLSDYASNADHYIRNNPNSQYKKNSIFDYVLTTNNPSWISNDLEADEKDSKFRTSSGYYKERYKSLAVFAIIPPGAANSPQNAIKGLLTFDSHKTKVFCEEECTMLMGLMAHLLHELLENLN